MKKSTLRFTHSRFSVKDAKEFGVEGLISQVPDREGVFEMQVDAIREFETFSDKVRKATGTRPEWKGLYDNDVRRVELRAAS